MSSGFEFVTHIMFETLKMSPLTNFGFHLQAFGESSQNKGLQK